MSFENKSMKIIADMNTIQPTTLDSYFYTKRRGVRLGCYSLLFRETVMACYGVIL